MKEMTQRVVILDNFSSPYVKQAIIVLKEYNPRLESKAIEDAEMIVSRYIEKMQKNEQPKEAVRKKHVIFKILAAVLLTALITLGAKLII